MDLAPIIRGLSRWQTPKKKDYVSYFKFHIWFYSKQNHIQILLIGLNGENKMYLTFICPTGTAHRVQNLLSTSVTHCLIKTSKVSLRKWTLSVYFVVGAQMQLWLKKNVCTMFVDPENFPLQISFLLFKDVPSQDMHNIELALLQNFQDTDIPELKDKMVFLASNSTSA